jgi:hypothetical protein
MKKYVILFLILFIFTISNASAFSGLGNGTINDPYQITNVTQLQEMENNLTANYILMNDIDASSINFDPIGNDVNQFTGNFFGNNYIINDLKIILKQGGYYGLFGYINDSTIINVSINNIDIYGDHLGDNDGGSNCIGSIVGYNLNGRVINCSSSGEYYAMYSDSIGGIVGYNNGIVNSCESNVYIEAKMSSSSGGVIGCNNGIVKRSFFNNYIRGTYDTGGIVGMNRGYIYDSYSNCTVNGSQGTGGIAGTNDYFPHGRIYRTYTSVNIDNLNDDEGAIAGDTNPYIYDSYYNINKTSAEGGGGGYGLNDTEMQIQSNFNNWDFIDIWEMEKYPILRQESSYLPNVPNIIPHSDIQKVTTTVNWNPSIDPNRDAVTYEVKVGTTSGGSDILSESGLSITESSSFSVEKGNTYYWSVRAYDGHEYSDWSTEDSFVGLNTPPNVPNLISEPDFHDENEFILEWDNSNDVDGDTVLYELRVGTTSGGSDVYNYMPESSGGISFQTHYDKYYWSVRAYDGEDYSSWATEDIFEFVNEIPTVPTGFTDLNNSVKTLNPTISWTKGTDNNGDTVQTCVYVGTDSTPTQLEGCTESNSMEIGNTIQLSDKSTYYYRLRSYDSYEYSSYTSSDEFYINLNAQPEISNVTILPDPIAVEDNINVSFDSYDADGDDLTYYYKWYKDGIIQESQINNSIDSSLTKHGEIWKVGIIANDGQVNSSEIQSQSVEIGSLNSAPTIDNIIPMFNGSTIGEEYPIKSNENITILTVSPNDVNYDNCFIEIGSSSGLRDIYYGTPEDISDGLSDEFSMPYNDGEQHKFYVRINDTNLTSNEKTFKVVSGNYISQEIAKSSTILDESQIVNTEFFNATSIKLNVDTPLGIKEYDMNKISSKEWRTTINIGSTGTIKTLNYTVTTKDREFECLSDLTYLNKYSSTQVSSGTGQETETNIENDIDNSTDEIIDNTTNINNDYKSFGLSNVDIEWSNKQIIAFIMMIGFIFGLMILKD